MNQKQETELRRLLIAASKRKAEYNDLTAESDNPLIREIRLSNMAAINTMIAVIDYLDGNAALLRVEASGII